MGTQAIDPILTLYRRKLDEIYGDRLERVVLFGSRARGDARVDSDYDVAVFLKSVQDRWQELDRLADQVLILLTRRAWLLTPCRILWPPIK